MNVVNMIDEHNTPGLIRMRSGKFMDLLNPKEDDIELSDIAWALSKQIRFNGHIPYDYTVARHSVIMSYYVPPEYALEALLHDCGEAYVGDMVQPLKVLIPKFSEIEDRISGVVFNFLAGGLQVDQNGDYHKSKAVDKADFEMYEHECHILERAGRKIMAMYEATRAAELDGLGNLKVTGMVGDYDAFMTRYYQLTGMQ
jgi:hypothetical protein